MAYDPNNSLTRGVVVVTCVCGEYQLNYGYAHHEILSLCPPCMYTITSAGAWEIRCELWVNFWGIDVSPSLYKFSYNRRHSWWKFREVCLAEKNGRYTDVKIPGPEIPLQMTVEEQASYAGFKDVELYKRSLHKENE